MVPSLPQDILHHLTKVNQPPYIPSPLIRFINGCVEFAYHEQSAKDEKAREICEWVFNSDKSYYMSTDACRAEVLNVDRKKLKRVSNRVAAAALLIQRCNLSHLEKSLAEAPGVRLLHYCEVMSYDETPMPIRMGDISADMVLRPEESHDIECLDLDPETARGTLKEFLYKTRSSLKSTATTAKLFQIQSTVGMLLLVWDRLRQTSRLVCLTGDTVNHLQVVDRTTAEVIAQCIRNCAAPSLGCRAFEQRTRLVASDRYSANIKAEKHIVQERTQWQLLHVGCEVHMSAGIHSKCFAPFSDSISGLIRVSLSMQHGGYVQRFRKFLRQTLKSSICVLPGSASEDAV